MVLGIEEDHFWHMNPRKLRPYFEAQKIRNKQRDEEMWIQGRYIYEATACAVDNVLGGKKSRATYRDKSYSKEWEEQHMSEEQKKQATLALFQNLQNMKATFEKTHPKKDVVKDE